MHYKLGDTEQNRTECLFPHVYTMTRVLYSVEITRQSNPPISQFNSLCNEFTSFWSMFVYNISSQNGDPILNEVVFINEATLQ